jgi:hypothetical protein
MCLQPLAALNGPLAVLLELPQAASRRDAPMSALPAILSRVECMPILRFEQKSCDYRDTSQYPMILLLRQVRWRMTDAKSRCMTNAAQSVPSLRHVLLLYP